MAEDDSAPVGLNAHFDADASVREEARASTAGPVRGAGQAAAQAAGGRRPRRTTEVAGEDAGARHNWIPRGPRNVGGRVRCLAVDPNDPRVIYAGPASGGVYKSMDGGETWFPLWHDEPSLSMAAIGICPGPAGAPSNVVWVATGESSTGGGESIPGNGVLRSADGGATWTGAAPIPVPVPPNLADMREFTFHALAAHPTKPNVCWAVGSGGAFVTRDSGATWTQYFGSWSDVAYAGTGANRRLFLVRRGPIGGRGVVERLDDPDPDAGPPVIDPQLRALLPDDSTPLPANRSTTEAGKGTGTPADGKIAICAATPDVAYLRFANANRGHFGIFRARNAMTAAANAITWSALTDHPDFAGEGQGEYNLTIAVSPANANHVASGMVDFHLSLNANANNATTTNRWIRGLAWDLFLLDRGQHADHHQTLFAPATAAAGAPIVLWDANDGGISRSDDWAAATAGYASGSTTLPVPDGVPTWRKMSHGITAPQMYDLTQSPVLPTLYGCGFQDNGVWITTGGPSWTPVLAADGGFVAFDPDDPYRFVVTWQEGIAGGVFPGLVRSARPRRGISVQAEVWPRVIHDGFEPVDTALFVAETAFDPHQPGVLLHARANRLYGTRPRIGDRWQVQPVGAALDLIYVPAANPDRAMLEVRDGVAARALGLLAGHARGRFENVAGSGRALRPARLRSIQPGPYHLDPASTLDVVLDGTVRTVRFAAGADLPDPANATPAQVAARITSDAGNGLRALPIVWGRSRVVQVRTRDVGAARRITVGGDAADFMGIVQRAHAGDDGLPALVTFGVTGLSGSTLDLAIDGGAVRHIVFGALPAGQDDELSAAQLAERIRAALVNDAAVVTTAPALVGLRFSSTDPNRTVTLTGTAVARLNLGDTPPQRTTTAVARDTGFDLEPPPPANPGDPPSPDLSLTVGDGTATAPALALSVAALGLAAGTVRTSITAVELRRAIRTSIPAAVRVRVDVVAIAVPRGDVREIHFPDAHPGHAWAGDTSGRLHHTADGGSTWQLVTGPFTDSDAIEAIAVDPGDPRKVYVGTYQEGTRKRPPPFMHRTDDGGLTWVAADAGIETSTHRQVGINALEIDPDHPAVLWAATDVGVFRSTDGATSWQPFNHGLPNTLVRDLAFVPSTRTLRAGAWGRGTWERHVGDRQAKDVALYLRANEADDGTVRPAATAVDALAPAPSTLSPAQSPDVKVARIVPAVGAFLDGVEFDEDVRHEEVVAGPAELLVQVHNGGAFPTTQPVRIAALWAFADGDPPPLPPGFWTTFHNGALTADATHGAWTVAFDATLPAGPAGSGQGVVPPGDPRVIRQPVTWPAGVALHRAVGVLAVVTGADDPIGTDLPLDVAGLLDRERRVAYRECAARHADDDNRIVLRRKSTTVAVQALARGTGFADLTAAGNPVGMPAGAVAAEQVLPNVGPFNLTPPGANPFGVRFESIHDIVVTFDPADPNLPNLAQATRNEVAGVIERALRAADVPVTAESRFFLADGRDVVAIVCRAPTSFQLVAATSTAAATLGLSTTAGQTLVQTTFAQRGPWNLTAGVPLTLHIRVTNRAELSFPNPTRGIANRAAVTAGELRSAFNRALDLARVPLRAEPRLLGLAVRRSVTEAVGTREHVGGPSLADLVVSRTAIAEADRLGRFAVLSAPDADTITAGQENHLYVRVLNVGNVRVEAARVRVLRLDPDASPVSATEVASRADVALDAGATAIVDLTWTVPAIPAASRVELLVVADLPAAGTDPRRPIVVPTDLADMDALDAYCARSAGVAWRQVVVA